jgi:hypothetical protein
VPDIKRFLDATRDGRHGVRDYAMMLMAYRHGLRVSELVDLLTEGLRSYGKQDAEQGAALLDLPQQLFRKIHLVVDQHVEINVGQAAVGQ